MFDARACSTISATHRFVTLGRRRRPMRREFSILSAVTTLMVMTSLAYAGPPLQPVSENGQGVFHGSISNLEPATMGRIFRPGGNVSTCPVAKACPGITNADTEYHYRKHDFVNTGGSRCISVRLDPRACGGGSVVFPVAYVGAFNPADLCQNYAGDPSSSSHEVQEFTIDVPLWDPFSIVVGEVLAGGGCADYTLTLTAIGANALARADFGGDGLSDFVLQSIAGDVATWTMSSSWTISSGAVVGNPGTGWSVKATGDLEGAGSADIVLQHYATGAVAIWHMAGAVIIGGAVVGTPGAAWQVVGTGDFNGDDKSDLILQNSSTRDVALWHMNGNTITAGAVIGSPGAGWSVVASGDFNFDSARDLILQHTDGRVAEWQMSVTGLAISAGAIVASPSPEWRVISSGDFDWDAQPELLLQNSVSFEVATWELDSFTLTTGYNLGSPGGIWFVKGTIEGDRDGRSDIVLRHGATGEIAVWSISGGTILGGYIIGSPGVFYVPILQ
jgi:hypothetical protein